MLKYIVRDFFFFFKKNLKLIHGHMEYESIDRIQTILVLFKPNTNIISKNLFLLTSWV